MKPSKYLIIFNPHAGGKSKQNVINLLVKALDHVEVVKTEAFGDITKFARETDADVVLAAGGDGTVNEAINGVLLNSNKKIIFGIIPLGTSNMCARSLGMTATNISEIVNVLVRGRTRKVDVGKINDRFFVNACGIGLDAQMFKNVQPKIKKFFGEVAYPLSLLKTIFEYKPHELTIEVDDKVVTGYYALICNIGRFTKLFQVIPDAKDDDGLLDILIFKNKDLLSQFKYLYSVFAKKHKENKDILHLQGKSFVIKSKESVLAHADAELIGTTPFTVSVEKKRLEVIVR